ncbi:MAG: hypothetical protein Q9208_006670 [Pyrenodesmia sp. 3 TL-2023]
MPTSPEHTTVTNFPAGVTTGFGGSADTRTDRTEALQNALLQMQQYGLLSKADQGKETSSCISPTFQAMPSEWVKGTMLVRGNTIARGHSAVTLEVIQAIVTLLQRNLTPVVPLRGSISASGDLSPLSYIAGTVTGNPDIYVRTPSGVVSAEQALQEADLKPIVLGPKEGLGLINGTATSAAVASLAVYEAHHLMFLSQVLTAMATEALGGNVAIFDPFLSDVRPHRGQRECAMNIWGFLQGSRLAHGLDPEEDALQSKGKLYQDRYALRTSPQWVGPQLEDLLLAHEQVTTELNSTTDNPLVDVSGQTTHHGGNFQAASITSAMEKTRVSLQMIGRLLFAQSSELINPMLNYGLPPNLAADEPSTSYTMKGVDIGMASYMSELGFLANPVSSHVQSAEMHNQALNSLALISARYTLQSIDLVSLMSASHLYTVCQALDLRVLQSTFFRDLEPALEDISSEILGRYLSLTGVREINAKLWAHVRVTWQSKTDLDSPDRITHIVDSALAIITQALIENPRGSLHEAAAAVQSWKLHAYRILAEAHTNTRSQFFAHQTTADYLGLAARKTYLFVRKTLGVPFHKGLEDHPTPKERTSADGRQKLTIGSWISIIHDSLRDGRLHQPLMECLAEAGLVPTEDFLEAIDDSGAVAEHQGTNGFDNGDTIGRQSNGSAVEDQPSCDTVGDHVHDKRSEISTKVQTVNGQAVNGLAVNDQADNDHRDELTNQ